MKEIFKILEERRSSGAKEMLETSLRRRGGKGAVLKKEKKKKIGRQKVKRTRKRDSKSLGGPLWKLVYVWLNSFGYLADLGMLVR